MFADAIEKVAQFTRPVHTIMRLYNNNQIIPAAATLFFVNKSGYAITCKHVVDLIGSSQQINDNYQLFRNERNNIPQDGKLKPALKGLELKYKYSDDNIIQIKNNFVDCIDLLKDLTFITHPTLDLAIIKFNGFENIRYQDCAHFIKNTSDIRQGTFLCRLGFPFPEFNNYTYNAQSDDIEWTQTGNQHSPRFPIEGMVTRFLADTQGLYGIELSTPGLRGQSGGPLFDEKGRICGMQFSTKHLHLGFDLEGKEILVNNKSRTISDYSFLHLGQCIHADTIKSFLKLHHIDFFEE